MSKLFVAFIFATFVFNYNHIIVAVAPESDEPTSTTTGNTPYDEFSGLSVVATAPNYEKIFKLGADHESFIQSQSNNTSNHRLPPHLPTTTESHPAKSSHGGLPPISQAPSSHESQLDFKAIRVLPPIIPPILKSNPDSNASPGYEPLTLIIKKDQSNIPFKPDSNSNLIPFSNVKIVSEKHMTDQLGPNEEKIYLCPHATELEKLRREYKPHRKILLFEENFSQGKAHQCSIEPQYLVKRQILEREQRNCIERLGLQHHSVGVGIAYPLIKEKNPETNEVVDHLYRKGMDELIDNVENNKIKIQDITIRSLMIEMYEICYDPKQQRANWIIRRITPWAQLIRNRQQQEQFYTREENNTSETTIHKIVPSEENSFKIWEHVTSYEYNQVLVRSKLKPLIDLIDESLEKYSIRVSRSLKVMTQLVDCKNVTATAHQEPLLEENHIYCKPDILIIQAYDKWVKSAITFVIHNTTENVPQENLFCKEPANCDFIQFFKRSTIYEKYVNDDMMKFVQCCKTMKDEFSMLSDIKIEKLIEIN